MLNEELRKRLMILNPEQLEAVHHEENPCLVVAGAGSGKTEVLTLRVARLISMNVPPDNIMVVTYTRQAKENMVKRLKPLIGEEMTKELYIGTFHSLCLRLIKERGFKKDVIPMATWKKESLIKEVAEKLNLGKIKVEVVSSWISQQKNELRNWNSDFSEVYDLKSEAYINDYIKIYREYEEIKKKTKEIDFDDMILFMFNMLQERDEVRWQLSQQFKHILVDEAQDSSSALLDIMKILTEMHNNIFLVGDVRQSIYGFANAKIDNLLNFENEWQDSKVIFLTQNYRSNRSIVELGNTLTNFNNHPYMVGNAKAFNTTKRDPIIKTCEDEYAEADFVCNEIKKLHNLGIKYKDMAIIYRINSQSCAVENMLRTYDIPYNVLGGNEFFESKEVQDIVNFLQLAINPHIDIALRQVYNKPYRKFGLNGEFIDKASEYAFNKDISLFNAIGNAESFTNNADHIRLGRQLHKKITKLGNFAKLYGDDASRVIEEIIYETGYYQAMQNRLGNDDREIDSFEALIQLGEKFKTPKSFLNYCLKGIIEAKSSNNRGDKVQLMTGHKSKGMEFKATFCIGLAQDLLPYKNNIEDINLFAEERRICYVNVTRAEEYLYITYPQTYKNKEKMVSPFLEEMLGTDKLNKVLESVYSKARDIEEKFEEKRSSVGTQISLLDF